MFSDFIFNFLAVAPNIKNRALTDPTKLMPNTYHTLLDSVIYGINTSTTFTLGVQITIFGILLFLIPKYTSKITPSVITRIFNWTGIWLFIEGLSRINYSLVMLNIDHQYPFLYYILPILRVILMFIGMVVLTLFVLYYSRIKNINTLAIDLDRSQRKFEAIVNSSNDAIIITNAKIVICHWNPAAEKIFGWSESEVQDKTIDIIIPPAYRERHRLGVERYLETREPVLMNQTIEISGLHKDGHEFPIELSLSTYGLNGSTYFTAIVRDISYRKKLQKKVQTLTNKIKKDNK